MLNDDMPWRHVRDVEAQLKTQPTLVAAEALFMVMALLAVVLAAAFAVKGIPSWTLSHPMVRGVADQCKGESGTQLCKEKEKKMERQILLQE